MKEDDPFEKLREEDPAAWQELMNTLPDVRDGLNRQQRALLVTMNKLGLRSDSRMKSTAYVSLNTPHITAKPYQPAIRTHLREIRFSEETGETETWFEPDLFDE